MVGRGGVRCAGEGGVSAKETFAKMSAGLDSNRKIRKAGRDGRDVFLWVLRQCAQRDSAGVIPSEDVLDFEHVADQLMCSEAEARNGLERACDPKVRLLEIAGDECRVIGWDEEWGRRPMTTAERAKRHRDKVKAEHVRDVADLDGDKEPSSVTEPSLLVTGNVTRNAERRGEEGEEKKERETPASPAPPKVAEFRLEPQAPRSAKSDAQPSAKSRKHQLPDEWTPSPELHALARELGVSVAPEIAKLRDWAKSGRQTKADWDATARNWIRRAAERPGPRSPPSGPALASPPPPPRRPVC